MAGGKKHINLALQGGGAHGAYTWGVLDRLLEEENLVIEGVSGTSAGAMNAAVMVNGHVKGGRQGAKDMLAAFWRRTSEMSLFSPLHKSAFDRMLTGWNMDWSLPYLYLDLLSRVLSPYELNPLNLNPLRIVLDETVDPEAFLHEGEMKLFVAATHVASGQARVFHCHEVNTEVLLASACIPFLFQAVEIDGEAYWDGGYMGNPAIWPLIYHCHSDDVVLVQINPIHRDEIPRRAGDIINRLNEISFNSSLIAEMRAIEFVKRLIDEGRLDRERYKDVKVHLIYSPEALKDLNASSKMNAGWDFLQHLHAIGRSEAEGWLKANFNDLGVRSTVDIRDKFLTGPVRGPEYGDLGYMRRRQRHAEPPSPLVTPQEAEAGQEQKRRQPK